jgi:hypothetical protein
MTAKLGVRHWCVSRDSAGTTWAQFHTAGYGRPRSARCTYCRGELVTETGLHCVLAWRGDGRYRLGDAVSTHASPVAAERAREKAYDAARARFGYGSEETNLVVRWIYVSAPAVAA